MLWGDHGYHLGQKNHIAKSALWQPATRTPLIIHLPSELAGDGGTDSDARQPKTATRCVRPVSLIDLYPTLIDLCGLPQRDDLDGRSIAPLVRDPTIPWPYPAIITHSPHWHGVNHAIRSQAYHYIRYSDGGEELYDMREDPNQWHNLADVPTYHAAKQELVGWLPKTNAEHFRAESR